MKKNIIYCIIILFILMANTKILFADTTSTLAPTQPKEMNNNGIDQVHLGSENSIPNHDPITKQTQIYCLDGTNVQYVIANMHFCKKHGSFLRTFLPMSPIYR